MADRIAYTQFKRRNNPPTLPLASNAIFDHPTSEAARNVDLMGKEDATRILEVGKAASYASPSIVSLASQLSDDEDCLSDESKSSDSSHKMLTHGQISSLRTPCSQIAIFPQYIAMDSTAITIREVDLPSLNNSFTVNLPNGREIFQIKRERPSLSHRQHVIDPVSNTIVFTIRRDIGKLPVSYGFDDDSETKVLDLQGNLSAPLQGARATAFFTNAIGQSEAQLFMEGSWHNRHATIKNLKNGESVATMKSEILNARNLIGSRRTYEVSISAGIDIALISGMIVALDARSS